MVLLLNSICIFYPKITRQLYKFFKNFRLKYYKKGKNYLEIPKQFLANDYGNLLDFQTLKKL